MIVAAALLAVLAVLLAWPAPLWLARSAWPDAAPGTAVLLWQAIAVAGMLSLLGSLLTFGLAPFGDHLLAAIGVVLRDVFGGGIPAGTPFVNLFALSAVVLLAGHLAFNLLYTVVRTERQRARHRSLLFLLSTPMPDAPRTRLIESAAPIAYCLPGTARSVTVLSAGLLDLLETDEVLAVTAHERAHVRQHHALVLTVFRSWHTALPWFPVASRAQDAVGVLVEMLADDQARLAVPAAVLSRAITAVASSGGALGEPESDAPAADSTSVERRVRRLLTAHRAPTLFTRAVIPVAAVALVVVPPVLLTLPILVG